LPQHQHDLLEHVVNEVCRREVAGQISTDAGSITAIQQSKCLAILSCHPAQEGALVVLEGQTGLCDLC
jgi:hypothetical protein